MIRSLRHFTSYIWFGHLICSLGHFINKIYWSEHFISLPTQIRNGCAASDYSSSNTDGLMGPGLNVKTSQNRTHG